MKTYKIRLTGRYWLTVRLYETRKQMADSVTRRWKIKKEYDYRAMFLPIKDDRDSGYIGEIVFNREDTPGINTVSHEATHAVSWLVCRKGWKNVFKMRGNSSVSRGGWQQEQFATMVGNLSGDIANRIW